MKARLVSKGLLIILAAGVALLSTPFTAYALADPDSISIEAINRYSGVSSTGDLLVTVEYVIEYTATPGESINEGWLGRLLDSSGQLASVQPFAGGLIPNDGYSRGMFSFYLSAPTITGSLSVRLQGNPSLSPTPTGISSASIETQTASELASDIRLAASRMENSWSQTLLTPLGGTIKFTTDGEDYFGNAIPNLSQYAPELFIFSARTPEFPEDAHPTTEIDSRKTLLDGTPIDNLFLAGSDYLGVNQDLLETIIVLLAALAIGGLVMAKEPDNNEIAIFAIILVAPLGGGLLGLGNWFLLGGFFSFLGAIALGWMLWGRRAG